MTEDMLIFKLGEGHKQQTKCGGGGGGPEDLFVSGDLGPSNISGHIRTRTDL